MKTIWLLIWVSWGQVLYAQADYFLKTINIDNTGSDNGLDIVADEMGYTVLCGSVTAVGGIGLFKTDVQGNKIWDNQVDFYPYDAGIRNFIRLPNSNYLISGGRQELNVFYQDLFSFVNSDNGSIYRHIVHGDTMDNRAASSLMRGDKIIAFTGITRPDVGLSEYNHTLLLTMDSTGVLLREDTLNNVEGYPINGSETITLLPTQEYVLGIGAQNEPNKVYGYLRKTDTIGTTLWEKKINNVSPIIAPLHLATLNNGNFVVSWIDSLGGITQGRGSYFVRCYNAAGDSLWQYTFVSSDYIRVIKDLHVCNNGDIIGTGHTTNMSITGSPTCWLFRLSPQGSLRWIREYVYWESASEMMQLFGVTEDPYGDIVATGFAILPDDSGVWTPQAVLLKVNAMGCFGNTGCNDTTIVYSLVTGLDVPSVPSLFDEDAPLVRVLPTAVSGEVLLVYSLPLVGVPARLSLYDLTGRLVGQRSLTVDEVFSTWSLPTVPPAGLYVYIAEQGGHIVARGKVVLR